MGSINNHINKLGMEVDIIPGVYTGSVQVLDKGVNTPFKGYLREQFEDWMLHKRLAPSATKIRGRTVGRQCMAPGDDSHHCQYLETYWTQGGQ
jgi:hypothetical protein